MEVALLQHLHQVDNVAHLHEYISEAGSTALILDRIRGPDLFEYVKVRQYLCEHEARRIFSQVIRIVADCHKNGVVHRDIKDENVLLDSSSGRATLTDFGCGAFLSGSDESYHRFLGMLYRPIVRRLRAVSMFLCFREGTRELAPPEWITDNVYKPESSTVWQLGTLLYSMVDGDIPFESDREILESTLVWHRVYSRRCRDLIARCMEKNPQARPSLAQIESDVWVVGK